jgi:hypothetical protein
MTGSQVSQNSGQPWSSSRGDPVPRRATCRFAPLTPTFWPGAPGQHLRLQAAAAGRDHRAVDLAAEQEHGGEPVQEHQEHHRGGQAPVGRCIGVREPVEIIAEAEPGEEPQDQGHPDPRQNRQDRAPAGGYELVGDDQHHRQQQGRDGDPPDRHREAQGLQARGDQHDVAPDQGAQHHQQRESQHREGAADHVADRFEPGQPPRAALPQPVGAVQADPQALDPRGREVEGEQGAERQHAAALLGEHPMDLAHDRLGDLPGPGVEDQVARLVGQRLRAEQAGERRQQDQEREQGGQSRERDVAGDRPAVMRDEALRREARDL